MSTSCSARNLRLQVCGERLRKPREGSQWQRTVQIADSQQAMSPEFGARLASDAAESHGLMPAGGSAIRGRPRSHNAIMRLLTDDPDAELRRIADPLREAA